MLWFVIISINLMLPYCNLPMTAVVSFLLHHFLSFFFNFHLYNLSAVVQKLLGGCICRALVSEKDVEKS